MFYVLSLKNN
jgi:drug/metabolite transporter (DMT)-like permease